MKKYLPLITFVPVIAVMAVLFIYRDELAKLGEWGYLGAFLIGFIANITVILPMPSLVLLFALGTTFDPVYVGLAGAAGGAVGEISSYIIGYSGRHFIKNNRLYLKAEGWMKKWGSAAIFVFALTPFLPFDVAGIAAGALRMRLWKFLAASFLGKAVLYVSVTLATAWGWHFAEHWFG